MIAGYQFIPGCKSSGKYTGGGWKLTLHTTQGTSISGAHSTLMQSENFPHVMFSPREKNVPKIQYLELNVAARSLANNNSDGIDTNRANVIQAEIVGMKDTAWTDAELTIIANEIKALQAECLRLNGSTFSLNHLDFGNPRRMSDIEYKNYDGITGHMHVPDNDHTDPGNLDIVTIVKKIKGEQMTLGVSKILGTNILPDTPNQRLIYGQIACNEQGAGEFEITQQDWKVIIPLGPPLIVGVDGSFPIYSVPGHYGSLEFSAFQKNNALVLKCTGAQAAAVIPIFIYIAKGA